MLVHWPRQADAQYRVDDYIRIADMRWIPAKYAAPCICIISERTQRIPTQICGARQGDGTNVEPSILRESSQDIAVATIVARPAQHSDTTRPRPLLLDRPERGLRRTAHQRVARDTERVDREAIQQAH